AGAVNCGGNSNKKMMMKKELFRKLIATGDSLAFVPVRLVAGTILAAHGSQKLFGWFGGPGLDGTAAFFEESLGLAPGLFWAFNAGAGEFFGGLMIATGALTRVGAGLNAIAMAVAVLLVHRQAFFASDGGMEYPLLLLAVSVTLLVSGAGGASVDRAWYQKRRSPHQLEPEVA